MFFLQLVIVEGSVNYAWVHRALVMSLYNWLICDTPRAENMMKNTQTKIFCVGFTVSHHGMFFDSRMEFKGKEIKKKLKIEQFSGPTSGGNLYIKYR